MPLPPPLLFRRRHCRRFVASVRARTGVVLRRTPQPLSSFYARTHTNTHTRRLCSLRVVQHRAHAHACVNIRNGFCRLSANRRCPVPVFRQSAMVSWRVSSPLCYLLTAATTTTTRTHTRAVHTHTKLKKPLRGHTTDDRLYFESIIEFRSFFCSDIFFFVSQHSGLSPLYYYRTFTNVSFFPQINNNIGRGA